MRALGHNLDLRLDRSLNLQLGYMGTLVRNVVSEHSHGYGMGLGM